MTCKKSFLLFKDMVQIVDELSDEEAGKLFKAISAYQNGVDHEVDDRVIKIALRPFISQFERDDQSYKNKSKKMAENGRLGGKKSAQKRSKKQANEANEANASKCLDKCDEEAISQEFFEEKQKLEPCEAKKANASIATKKHDLFSSKEANQADKDKDKDKDKVNKKTISAAPLDFSMIKGMSQDQFDRMVGIRKANKAAKINQSIVKTLSKKINTIVSDLGYTLDEILDLWEERGWKSVEADWIPSKMKDKPMPSNIIQPHNYSATTAQNIQNTGKWRPGND